MRSPKKKNNNEIKIGLSPKSNLFLHRNLIYNKNFTSRENTEYILHIVTKNHQKKDLNSFINNFVNQRKSRSFDNDDLIVVNSSNIHEYEFINEDKEYYFSYTGCLFCKGSYKSFEALIIHMKFCHNQFDTYFSRCVNPFTKITENHLLVLSNNKSSEKLVTQNQIANDKNPVEFKNIPLYVEKISDQELYNKISEILTFGNLNIHKDSDKPLKEKITLNKEKEPKQQYKFYQNPIQNRVFFHSITGEIINESSDDSEKEIENDDIIELQMNAVDDFTDVCEKDKQFFKLWGKFMAKKNKCILLMEKLVKEFITENLKILTENQLNEQFLLHLITLFDAQQLDKENFVELIKFYNQLKEN